jgi:hypothetical protein
VAAQALAKATPRQQQKQEDGKREEELEIPHSSEPEIPSEKWMRSIGETPKRNIRKNGRFWEERRILGIKHPS